MLKAEKIDKHFGGLHAVKSVTLEAEEGCITGLIGPNGAGKTTCFNLMTGFIKADSGTVIFNGEDITKTPTAAIALKGLYRTFQTPLGFPQMTVQENMLTFFPRQTGEKLLALLSKGRLIKQEEKRNRELADLILARLGLICRKMSWVSDLCAGELKLLEFARVLMAEPKMILLDEPASGVNPAMLDKLSELLFSLKEEGKTMLIVDHNLRFITDVCDKVYVLAEGALIFSGAPAEAIKDPNVKALYLGKKVG